MQKRSRVVLLALAMALALVLSSCWQIRLVKVNKWTAATGEVAVITFDLYPAIDMSGENDGYPIVIAAYGTQLQNRGTTFDVFNNYNGKEKGTSDATLRSYMVANAQCDVGGTEIAELSAEWANLKVFRPAATVTGPALATTDALRVKWRVRVTNDALEGVPAPFVIMTGVWFDNDTDGVPDSDDTFYCSSSFGNTILPTAP